MSRPLGLYNTCETDNCFNSNEIKSLQTNIKNQNINDDDICYIVLFRYFNYTMGNDKRGRYHKDNEEYLFEYIFGTYEGNFDKDYLSLTNVFSNYISMNSTDFKSKDKDDYHFDRIEKNQLFILPIKKSYIVDKHKNLVIENVEFDDNGCLTLIKDKYIKSKSLLIKQTNTFFSNVLQCDKNGEFKKLEYEEPGEEPGKIIQYDQDIKGDTINILDVLIYLIDKYDYKTYLYDKYKQLIIDEYIKYVYAEFPLQMNGGRRSRCKNKFKKYVSKKYVSKKCKRKQLKQ